MAYANGKIPYSAMTALSTGGHLLAPAAAAFEVWRIQAARAGFDLRPTSASDTFRPYDVQERIFRDRYRPGNLAGRSGFTNDVRYWPGQGYWTRRTGTAAAAVPGTSNHGKALAVDIRNAGAFGGPFHAWMSRTGPALGWSNTEGRSVNEPWHWVHSGAQLVDNPISGGSSVTVPNIPSAPAPITPEDDMSQADVDAINRKLDQLLAGVGAIGAVNTPPSDTVLGIVRDLRGAIGAGNGASTPPNSSVLANVRAAVTKLSALPNDVWMYPVIGRHNGTTEVHPAAEWFTVMAYRLAGLASAPTGGPTAVIDPKEVAEVIADSLAALPDGIAQRVVDIAASRLTNTKG